MHRSVHYFWLKHQQILVQFYRFCQQSFRPTSQIRFSSLASVCGPIRSIWTHWTLSTFHSWTKSSVADLQINKFILSILLLLFFHFQNFVVFQLNQPIRVGIHRMLLQLKSIGHGFLYFFKIFVVSFFFVDHFGKFELIIGKTGLLSRKQNVLVENAPHVIGALVSLWVSIFILFFFADWRIIESWVAKYWTCWLACFGDAPEGYYGLL